MKGLFNSDTQKKWTFGEDMWSAKGIDCFNKSKTNWDRTYANVEQKEELANWCEYIKGNLPDHFTQQNPISFYLPRFKHSKSHHYSVNFTSNYLIY